MGSSPVKKIRPQCVPKADRSGTEHARAVQQDRVDGTGSFDGFFEQRYCHINTFRLKSFCTLEGPIIQAKKVPWNERNLVCRTKISRPIGCNHDVAAAEFLRSLNCINALAKQGNVAFVRIFGSLGTPNRIHFRVEPSGYRPGQLFLRCY